MTEFRVILVAIVVLCGAAPLTIVWPFLDAVMTTLVIGAAALAVAGYWLRETVREIRFRREMCALDNIEDVRRAGFRTQVHA